MFRNIGEGRFADMTASAGPAFAHAGIGRAAAVGDVDNDGDQDLVVTSNGGPAALLLNQSRENAVAHHWIDIALRQPAGNRFAFGARVGVARDGQPTLWRRVRTDGSYLSASDARIHVGLGPSAAITALIVQWPDGDIERRTGVEADHQVTLTRSPPRGAR